MELSVLLGDDSCETRRIFILFTLILASLKLRPKDYKKGY